MHSIYSVVKAEITAISKIIVRMIIRLHYHLPGIVWKQISFCVEVYVTHEGYFGIPHGKAFWFETKMLNVCK